MPPRGYKRRRSVVGGWSRRVRLRKSYQRPYYRRSAFRSRYKKRFRRRSFKKRSFRRYRRRSGRGMKSFRNKVIRAIAHTRTFTAEYGQEHTVPVESAGKSCKWFMVEGYTNTATVDDVNNLALFDHDHVMAIADQYRSSTVGVMAAVSTSPLGDNQMTNALKQKILFTRAKQISLIRNQSNENVHITAYYCKPRGKVRFSSLSNTYQILSTGFANNGLDPTHTTPSTNVYMSIAYTSLYQSYDFCKLFKIYKVKKRTISPSQITPFSITSGRKVINPADWCTVVGSAATSWSAATQSYNACPPQKFIMFKLVANPAGYGAAQATYCKLIQQTTPTIVMDTTFRYETKMVPSITSANVVLDVKGITDSIVAGQAPAIIVPDGDVIGVEDEAE